MPANLRHISPCLASVNVCVILPFDKSVIFTTVFGDRAKTSSCVMV